MKQTLLPLVPDGATPVNDLISVVNRAKATRGKELSPDQRAKFEELTQELAKTQERVARLEQRADRSVADIAIRRAGVQRYNRMSNTQKDVELDALTKKASQLLKAGCN